MIDTFGQKAHNSLRALFAEAGFWILDRLKVRTDQLVQTLAMTELLRQFLQFDIVADI